MLSRAFLLILNGAILSACTVFIKVDRELIITALLLFLPFIDNKWTPTVWYSYTHSSYKASLGSWQKFINYKAIRYIGIITIFLSLTALHPNYINTIISTLLFTALPEEWFFRGYLMKNINELLCNLAPTTHTYHKLLDYKSPSLSSNAISSTLFSLLHVPTQGLLGLSTFLPSLLFGWIYQKTHDLVLVIFLHAISNTVFYIYIAKII